MLALERGGNLFCYTYCTGLTVAITVLDTPSPQITRRSEMTTLDSLMGSQRGIYFSISFFDLIVFGTECCKYFVARFLSDVRGTSVKLVEW